MPKIQIITLQNVANYGSVLQAVATQKLFEGLDFDVEFYNYKRKESLTLLARFKNNMNKQGFKGIIKSLLWTPSWISENRIFPKFLKKYLNVIPQVVTENEDFKKLSLNADVYCTGSDQTWNSGWNNGILPPLFLDFVPQGKKHIAYAASFGKNKLENSEKEETKKYLSKYAFISVREESAVEICRDLGINAIQVLDPTLQIDSDFWRKFSKPVMYKRYCLLYQLNTNREFDRFAVEFCKRKGLKLIRFCHRLDKMFLPADVHLPMPPVEDFISYIDNADFVLTDSFHCSAFSSNLNKQFLSFFPEYGGRIESLLNLLHLNDRHIEDLNDVKKYCSLPDIDYTEANGILNKERDKAFSLLQKALVE